MKLIGNRIDYDIMIDDVQKLVEKQKFDYQVQFLAIMIFFIPFRPRQGGDNIQS